MAEQRNTSGDPTPAGDMHESASPVTAAHITEARQRAQRLLEGELLGSGLVGFAPLLKSARHAVLATLAIWAVLLGLGQTPLIGPVLIAAVVVLAMCVGVSEGLDVRAQRLVCDAELIRERDEIRERPEDERDEVRALYEAKGFSGPLLESIVETICADDDRLLKVMLEEELGLFMEHLSHPVTAGVSAALGWMIGGFAVAIPAWASPAGSGVWWVGGSAAVFLGLLGVMGGRPGDESLARRWATSWIAAGTIGGVAYWIAQALAA